MIKYRRIIELVNKEKDIRTDIDGGLNYYTRQDLEELFNNINEFLGERKIDQDVLSAIDPVIKKYYKYKDKREDGYEERDEPIYESNILILGNVPLRAYAIPCQLRITWHSPTLENNSISKSLTNDSNSYVRESVCKELAFLYEIDPNYTTELAKVFCYDNKYVRWYLRIFLNYLVHKDRKSALEIFLIIIETYGKKELVGQGEDVLLRYTVSVVTQIALLIEESDYLKLLEEMIMNREYNVQVKKEIVFTLRDDRFIGDQSLTERIIYYLHRLLTYNLIDVKAHVEFFFLYHLIQKNISLLPKTIPLLDEISKIKYPVPILTYDHTFHFTLLEYIEKFFESFPDTASVYFLRTLDQNEFLINSLETEVIIKILIKIFNSNLDLQVKRQAKTILDKINSESYWQVRDLKEKTKELS